MLLSSLEIKVTILHFVFVIFLEKQNLFFFISVLKGLKFKILKKCPWFSMCNIIQKEFAKKWKKKRQQKVFHLFFTLLSLFVSLFLHLPILDFFYIFFKYSFFLEHSLLPIYISKEHHKILWHNSHSTCIVLFERNLDAFQYHFPSEEVAMENDREKKWEWLSLPQSKFILHLF